ncbi:MAG: cell division protein FtsH, partial [Candidatus Levybacteria bacterium]|nr:cell division protein FtsH [Candidatus Levybacteria bacterium]
MASKFKNNHPHRKQMFKMKIDLSWKNIFLYSSLVFFVIFLFMGFVRSIEEQNTVALSQVIKDVNEGKVKQITVLDNRLIVTKKDNTIVQTFKEPGSNVYQIFRDTGVSKESLDRTNITIKDETGLNSWINILSAILPVALMIAFFYFLFR